MAALAERYDEIQEYETEVWAISVDAPGELANLREQLDLPFELLGDKHKSLIAEWDIVNEKERGGIAFPNTYIISQNREVVLHSRDKTASRTTIDPLVKFLERYEEDPSQRREIESQDKSFQWPSFSSLVWGIPRKLGCMSS